jgi:hypothetical protein
MEGEQMEIIVIIGDVISAISRVLDIAGSVIDKLNGKDNVSSDLQQSMTDK